MTWLAHTPSCVVRAHAVMLTRLEAEDALQFANATGLGTGNLKEPDQYANALKRLALGDAGESKPNPAMLAQHGFAVRRIKRAPRPASAKDTVA